ncbi:PCRF domain-containing protein, partial [Staphylococcus epidermidis]|uniref:PCRF domain-containing protein n=1 Tax=Staphylococcus epidermidis TaxID=1282 RepID=UPI0037DA38F7
MPTESQHCVTMLLSIYQPYSQQNPFKVQTLHYLPPHQPPLKTLTLLIKPHNPYGYLKPQKALHRLLTISPFDSS